MTQDISKRYPLVDTNVGSRLLLGFTVSASAIQQRLPSPWQISSLTAPYTPPSGLSQRSSPNLMVVFNNMLLNQDAQGGVRIDGGARYMGFVAPAANPETGEHGMMHLRIFTGHPHAVPGAFHDALPAQVRHEQRIIEEGTSSTVMENLEVYPEIGGNIELQLIYERGPLIHRVADTPNFPVWAALDSRIVRVYQENYLLELVLYNGMGINRVKNETFRLTVPEMADLFDGSEQLVAIIANPQYQRKVFSSGIEYATD